MNQKLQISETYQEDIYRAIKILKEAGCSEVFLFGSLTVGKVGAKSDIDLAIRGCPQDKFFHLFGKLLMELNYPVDLVNLDSRDAFARYLEKEGALIPID